MPIEFYARQRLFLLRNREMSYALQVSPDGYLHHVYWGKKIREVHDFPEKVQNGPSEFHTPDQRFPDNSLETSRLEYPAYGNSDFRYPAVEVEDESGSCLVIPKFKTYQIQKGKPPLPGLPATYVEVPSEADTLVIQLCDEQLELSIFLLYTVYAERNVITRSAKLVNTGDKHLQIRRALSASVDFEGSRYEFLHLSGSWTREQVPYRLPISPGMNTIESRRGASSHEQNPFAALISPGTDETCGNVYAMSLLYSGNFKAGVEVSSFFTSRFFIGINPFAFSWKLEPEQSFQTPEAVMVYSDEGLGKMSRTFHSLYRERLCRGYYRDKVRPILINSWEAFYFQFNSKDLLRLAQSAKKLGIELFVLDDGWFANRNDDCSSLGDWEISSSKIPEGLPVFGREIHDIGLRFGLWFEPEMVSPNSKLYRKHPDWCLHIENRPRTLRRHQLVLDLSRQDVCKYLEEMLTRIFSKVSPDYIKWDMNRNITEAASALLPPDRQQEVFHRYILNLYKILDALTRKFPHILFENCASGGGRFDPGMLFYMPQTWASDDTDAVERLKIQKGCSMVYPPVTICSHVSAVPNHQIGRTTSLDMRGHVAMTGTFGYELDISALSAQEKEKIKQQINLYKNIRQTVQFGEFYRLSPAVPDQITACQFCSQDGKQICLFIFTVLCTPNVFLFPVKMQGLDPDEQYKDLSSGTIYGGDELMYRGFPVFPGYRDFSSALYLLRPVE
jgi:alpha-galactosidase